MSKKDKSPNTGISFLAMLLLAWLVFIPLLFGVLKSVFGSPEDIIVNTIDLLPFGTQYFELSVKICNEIFNQQLIYHSSGGSLTVSLLFQEVAKLLMTSILFLAINKGLCLLLGLDGSRGRWNSAKKIVVSVFSAFLATGIVPMPLNYIFSNLGKLHVIWASVTSILISVILVGGGIAFCFFFFSIGILNAVGIVIVKVVCINLIKISCCYVLCFIMMISIEIKDWDCYAGSVGAIVAVLIIIAGLEMMADAVFTKR